MDFSEKLALNEDVNLSSETQRLLMLAAEEISNLQIQLTAARLTANFYESHARECSEKLNEWMSKFLDARKEQQQLIGALVDVLSFIDEDDGERIRKKFNLQLIEKVNQDPGGPAKFPKKFKDVIKRAHMIAAANDSKKLVIRN